jgi:Transposase
MTPPERKRKPYPTDLSDWLAAAACTQVAMEATGVFWKPLYTLLEDRFAVLVVNAAPSKAVPGRKTAGKAAEWIADLLRPGLLRASFLPDRPQRELRALTRSRTPRIQERAHEVNRVREGCSQGRTSSWHRWRPTSWASRGAICSSRWSAGPALPPRWRSSNRRALPSSARSSAS